MPRNSVKFLITSSGLIHPLAVIISRATYLLAIRSCEGQQTPDPDTFVSGRLSLFLPAEVTQYSLGEAPGFEIRFGDHKVSHWIGGGVIAAQHHGLGEPVRARRDR